MAKISQEKKQLDIIVETFKTYDVDWMNYKITKENPLQYHHIIFKKDGGLSTFENGAPLTHDSHSYFHVMYRKDYIDAKHITRLFQKLHEEMLPPNEEHFEKVNYYIERYENKRVRIYVK